MSINATLLGQMLVFAGLIWFTMKFVWPILIQAMDEREAKIASGLAAAEQGEKALADAESEADRILQEGREKAQDFIAQAQKRADDLVNEAKTSAREESERLLAQARAEIEQERLQARESIRQEVANLAVTGAEQILMQEIDRSKHQALLGKLVAQI